MNIEYDLREIDFGKWEGIRESDLIAAYGGYAYYPDFLQDPDRWRAPGEQLFSEAQPRIVKCMERILREYLQGDLLIATHAGVIKLLLMNWFSINEHSVFPRIVLDNASISVIQMDARDLILRRFNDIAHLESN